MVPYLHALVAYQTSLVEPWFLFWLNYLSPEIPSKISKKTELLIGYCKFGYRKNVKLFPAFSLCCIQIKFQCIVYDCAILHLLYATFFAGFRTSRAEGSNLLMTVLGNTASFARCSTLWYPGSFYTLSDACVYVFFVAGKKKQEHNPNAPPLNRQIPFPDM